MEWYVLGLCLLAVVQMVMLSRTVRAHNKARGVTLKILSLIGSSLEDMHQLTKILSARISKLEGTAEPDDYNIVNLQGRD